MTESSECSKCYNGPGYKSPSLAMQAPKEKIIYSLMINCSPIEKKPDSLATIDVDPSSPNYSKIIHKLDMSYIGDEIHHFGWNACSSCCNDPNKVRRFMVIPGLRSSRIYIVDTIKPTSPSIHKIIEPEEIKKHDLSSPHTVHCLADGNVMISFLGNANGEAPGGFLLFDSEFNVKSRWGNFDQASLSLNYDFWYQPYHNIMVSSEWAAPKTFFNGFDVKDVEKGKYGRSISFWNWKEQTLIKKIDLGAEGQIPLEVRFHHNPKSTHGYVGAALSSAIWHWWKGEDGDWKAEKAVQIDPVNLESWPMPVPSLITDILLSMDDKYIYISNWFHGDVRQYDITDPWKPKLVGQVWCGGLIGKETYHKDNKLAGGPQMLQLSLDGQRLYVTNSLFSSWDDQFFPDMANVGSYLLKINCDTEKGGLTIDPDFYIDFGSVEGGPYRGHESRYPNGDCTSDIWIE